MNDWLERHRALVLSAVGLAIAGSVLAVALRWQRPAVIEIVPPPATPTPGMLNVYVSGAVQQPDVYLLPPDALVRDAIEAAGGPTHDADLNAVNLAAALFDNQQVLIPVVGAAPVAAEGDTAPVLTGPVNVNIATAAELETLPGIGPSLAQAIIDYRETYGPFSDPSQLVNVPGIGPAKLAELEGLVIAQ